MATIKYRSISDSENKSVRRIMVASQAAAFAVNAAHVHILLISAAHDADGPDISGYISSLQSAHHHLPA